MMTIIETVATLPGDLGWIPIAEALKSATSRTGGKPNVIARGPESCSPGISRARSRIGPGYLATVSYNWTLGGSPTLNPKVFPLTGKLYTGEQITAKQVKMIVDLVIRRDPRYREVVPNKLFQKTA